MAIDNEAQEAANHEAACKQDRRQDGRVPVRVAEGREEPEASQSQIKAHDGPKDVSQVYT